MLNNIKKIKAFTIFELIIVIIIIWVLMAATMRFGWNRIWLLKNKNIQEQFISQYEDLFLKNIMSNYYWKDIYQKLDINIYVGWKNLEYVYSNYWNSFTGYTIIEAGSLEIKNLNLWWQKKSYLNVALEPYNLKCSINWQNDLNAEIEIFVNNSKSYCFWLQSDNCRIRNISCK